MFVRGLALGRLDEFSIEQYEKILQTFLLHFALFESCAMGFSGRKSPRHRSCSSLELLEFYPFIIIICVVSSECKILQTAQIRNFEPKERHHKTGKVNLRLFSMYLFILNVGCYTQFCEPFCSFARKILMCTQTVCLGPLRRVFS